MLNDSSPETSFEVLVNIQSESGSYGAAIQHVRNAAELYVEDFHALIAVKNKGNLSFPSKDVYTICVLCEKIFREKVLQSGKSNQYIKLAN